MQMDHLLEDYHNVTQGRIKNISSLKNDVIVITGGTGFMGTWLAGLLSFLNDHYAFNTKIILLSRHIDIFKKTRPHLAHRHDVLLISADVKYLHEFPSETNWVIHAAATPDNRIHATNPIETMHTIANGTQYALNAIERCSDLKMFLNISSGLIYGSQAIDQSHFTEKTMGRVNCGTVSSAYAEAKRFAETLCHSFRSQSRIPIVTARPFAFIGPFQSIERPWALNNFIKDALNGKPINVFSDGNTVRSYMYASDMAFWLLTILTQAQSGEVYNVGSPERIRLADLAMLVKEQVDPTLEIRLQSRSNELQHVCFVPDITLAKEQLQLDITVDLLTAVKRTVQWNKTC